ncbi:MAG: 3-oxoacyl-ACP synthase, partial [Alkalispirochaeta sp.]
MNTAKIASVGAYVPSRRMHNDELARIVDTSDEWIYSHTGIRYRHIAAENESAGDLAVPAAEQAIERAGIEPDDIDLVLLATSTPDYVGLPSTACVVQDRLDIKDAGAMDVVAACSGFVYALETARVYVEAGAMQNVLVVGSEVYSKI